MTRGILIAVLLLAARSTAAAERAIWAWEQDSYAMLQERAAGDAAIAFLKSKRIQILYLYADAFQGQTLLQDRAELYRTFIRQLHGHGLRVYALLGSAYLHTEEYILPEHRSVALAMFQRVLDYNAAAKPGERFDGINLDIEPHVLDQWGQQKMQLLGQFLELGQAFMELKRASGQSLLVGPAIPFWLDGIVLDWHGTARPVSEQVIDIYDYVALMDYRDHAAGPDGLVSLGADEMEYANRTGKKVVIGVDISPGEIQKTSFDHLAEADLERELALTERAFRGSPAFAGFALHHFGIYRRWLERNPHTSSAGADAAPPRGPSRQRCSARLAGSGLARIDPVVTGI